MYIKRVSIKNFRTLLDFEIELDEKFQIIAGANNSGKSNLLRALNIFFNEGFDENSYYEKDKDLSYHIEKGTGSSSSPTSIEIDLFLKNEEIKKIKDLSNNIINNNILRTKAYYAGDLEGWYYSNLDGTFPTKKELKDGSNKIEKKSHSIRKLFNRIQFMYIPAQYDIGGKINQLVAEEILPTMVDTYGNTGLSSKVKELKNKIDEVDTLTKEVLKEKNELLSQSFRDVIQKFPEIQAGIDLEQYALEVSLTGDSLAEILSKRIILNVKDASHKEVDSKGSGIQKLVLITLLEYFSKNIETKARYTNPFLIWAIDEPETYMQPKLQKQISQIFKNISETHQVICTTHSPKMIDIYNPQNVKLFYLKSEPFPVARQGGKIMFKKMTEIRESSDIRFIEELKEHFGVESNDGWILRDKNILFEGNDDVIYFHTTFELIMGYRLDVANIVSSSSENMPNFAELLFQQIANKELQASSIICLLDNDESGIKAFDKINKYKADEKKSKKYIKTFKTISLYMLEKAFSKTKEIIEQDEANKEISPQEKEQKIKLQIPNLIKNLSDNKHYPCMIEDNIIPEIFFEALIDFLKNMYKTENLSNYNFEKYYEFRKSILQVPIMQAVDNYFCDLIEQTNGFSFTNLGVKYTIATKYKDISKNISEEKKVFFKEKYFVLDDYFKEFI